MLLFWGYWSKKDLFKLLNISILHLYYGWWFKQSNTYNKIRFDTNSRNLSITSSLFVRGVIRWWNSQIPRESMFTSPLISFPLGTTPLSVSLASCVIFANHFLMSCLWQIYLTPDVSKRTLRCRSSMIIFNSVQETSVQ